MAYKLEIKRPSYAQIIKDGQHVADCWRDLAGTWYVLTFGPKRSWLKQVGEHPTPGLALYHYIQFVKLPLMGQLENLN